MIPTYLQSLAASVRDLVASGKAVHVNKETAAELDLLAGLPWDAAERACAEINQTPSLVSATLVNPITPADLALGWLLASRALTHSVDVNDGLSVRDCAEDHEIDRAAECAELAKEAAQMLVLKRAAQIVPMPWTAETMGPYLAELQAAATGTRQGARAAWGFVVEQLTRSADSIEENTRKPDANIDRFVGKRLLCADRYRRELEAM